VARRYLQEHGDRLAIIGMAGLDSPPAMQGFVDTFGLDFPQVVDEDASEWPRFSIALQGAWYFLDEDGHGTTVPYDLTGAQLAETLDQLLAD
jgi:hypothetical protein